MRDTILLGIAAGSVFLSLLAQGNAAPPSAQNVHAYFDKLKAMPEKVADYSLRDQAQIDRYRVGRKQSTTVTYNPAGDIDPRKQDAAKVFIPENGVSLPNQVRLPIPETRDGSLLVTWDAWFGKEFAFANTKISNYKNFQFSSKSIFTEVQSRFALAKPPAVAMVSVRQYGAIDDKTTQWGSTVNGIRYGSDNLGPMRADFAIMPETWTRYWMLFEPAGEWYDISLWVADENRDAVQILDKARIKPRERYWDLFWLEYNTSSEPPSVPARTGYFRNLVMLKSVADPKKLFERPLGNGTVAEAKSS
jgi:hypothetical protein